MDMPRQRTRYRRAEHALPDDFPERLERFKEVSGLSWSELARRLWTSPVTLWRWRNGVKPHPRHLRALHEAADERDLLSLLTTGTSSDVGTAELQG